MEKIIKSVGVYDRDCLGCKRHKREVMITFSFEGQRKKHGATQYHDFFLTREQAIQLSEQLDSALLTEVGVLIDEIS